MKLKDIKIGQIVVDKLGNEYKVLFVCADGDDVPVELECIKFSKKVNVDDTFASNHIGQCFWIYKSKKIAKFNGAAVDNLRCVTVKSLKLKKKQKAN